MMNTKIRSFLILVFLTIQTNAQEKLTTANLFTDGIVLQQKSKSPIWGWGVPKTKITITTSWGTTSKAKVEENGKWICKLKTPKAGGPYEISITDETSVVKVKNVLIGEVWICSGQSNMDMPLKGWPPNQPVENSAEEIAKANFPKIRMFNVGKAYALQPEKDVKGTWETCTPETVKNFSAVGYFFGKKLFENLNIPIGLIHVSHGSSPAEAWMPKEELREFKRFENIDEEAKKVAKNLDSYNTWFQNLPIPEYKEGRKLEKFKDVVIGDIDYKTKDYNDSEWKTIELPASWESFGFKKFDGIIWYRKNVIFSKFDENNDVLLDLGLIEDIDECYFNGVKIGESILNSVRKKERTYTIPKNLIVQGKNTIAIRVVDVWGKAGFMSNRAPKILQNNKILVDMTPTWKYLPSAEFFGQKFRNFNKKYSYANKPYLPFLVDEKSPITLYNGMLAPVIPYKAKGIIWYQGESNTSYAKEYYTLFPKMIERWRKDWKSKKLPFYFAQIAPLKNYDNDKGKNTAELREAQFQTQKLPNTGMAVLLDLGNKWKIHPEKKKEVGERLSLWALHKDYNFKKLAYSGPQYKSVKFKNGKAILSFENVHDGLELRNDNKTIFQIAGKNGKFYPANVKIEKKIHGDYLIVWSDKVLEPTKVTYGFTNWVEPSLYNKNGLPASSFRTE